ncbi:unknown [Salmonella phage FelixO1]|uniref:Uncharacterized protein n=1 Tax=Salmonella phage Felix O1 (isolate Felix O1-VT1) TaxID=1283336 RepID=Q6KGH5_BPFO1|nr:unknown [Salmonella phage FelixO1]
MLLKTTVKLHYQNHLKMLLQILRTQKGQCSLMRMVNFSLHSTLKTLKVTES